MTELFQETYMAFSRKSAMVRERMPEWHAVDAYQHRDVDAAWRQVLSQAADVGIDRPDPADYVIVGGSVTHETNGHGASRVIADWTRTFDPQSFHEEVERARRLAEDGPLGIAASA